jgi:hypothetical protein
MPLEHILAPLLARKAAEIAQQTAAPAAGPDPHATPTTLGPRGRGYLQQQATPPAPQPAPSARKGGEATKPDTNAQNTGGKRVKGFPVTEPYTVPEGLIGQSLMTQVPAGDIKPTLGYLGGLAGGAFANGMQNGATKQGLRSAGGDPSVTPMATAEQKLAQAVPVQAAPKDGKHPIVIKLPAGAVGFAEDGQAVNAKGKKLGYLQQHGMPNAPNKSDKSVDPSAGERTLPQTLGI